MSDAKRSEDKETRAWLPRVTIALVIAVALLAAGVFAQMHDIERGLLSVTADQQDQYVSLVVSQINMKDNRNDQQIIEKILGSIDGTASQYWTFSRDDTMLFVRDVTETSKYKGLPASTYLQQGPAADFYNGLSTDGVQHAYITIDGKEYIASGQAFAYKGSTYRLVLLTNESVVLDNNQVLGARSRLGALLGIETALLLFVGVWLAYHRDRATRRWQSAQAEVGRLTKVVERLNAHIAHNRAYDAGNKLWRGDELAQFERSLATRRRRAWLAQVSFADAPAGDAAGSDSAGTIAAADRGKASEASADAAGSESAAASDRQMFLERLEVMTDRDVARFAGENGQVMVLFLNADEEAAHSQLAALTEGLAASVAWKQVGWADDHADRTQEGDR